MMQNCMQFVGITITQMTISYKVLLTLEEQVDLSHWEIIYANMLRVTYFEVEISNWENVDQCC